MQSNALRLSLKSCSRTNLLRACPVEFWIHCFCIMQVTVFLLSHMLPVMRNESFSNHLNPTLYFILKAAIEHGVHRVVVRFCHPALFTALLVGVFFVVRILFCRVSLRGIAPNIRLKILWPLPSHLPTISMQNLKRQTTGQILVSIFINGLFPRAVISFPNCLTRG